MKPDWNSRFDAVYLLGYTGYKERIPTAMAECRRVGLSPVVMWQFPTPYDHVIQGNVKLGRGTRKIGFFNSFMGHYRTIKTAYCTGSETCLVVEDDIRFLKDTEKISEALRCLPPDWDVVLFDIMRSASDYWYEFSRLRSVQMVNPIWCRAGDHPRSFGCYGLSRRAMEHFIKMFEAPALSSDATLINADEYLDANLVQGLHVYFPFPNVCVQRIDIDKGSNSFQRGGPACWTYYWHLLCNGIDLSQYNIEDVEMVDGLLDVANRTGVFHGGVHGRG